MKKKLALALACALLLAGCGKGGEEDTSYIYAAPPAATGESESDAPDPANPHDVDLPEMDGDVIEIKEKLFIAQTNDIYLNGADYIGKTIRYEGIYKTTESWDDGMDEIVHYVIRYGPGCCGFDGEAGFEIRWDGEWPAEDDWVEVVGTIAEEEYESGYRLLYVQTTALTVKTERGAEYVAT